MTDLSEADLTGANLSRTNFRWMDFRSADLSLATLSPHSMIISASANLSGANLSGANLSGADISEVNLSGANLSGADCSWANLSRANLSGADLTGCYIYATSAWDVTLTEAIQVNLIITSPEKADEEIITVDNLEVAQFIYLLLNNQKIRDVIDTITSKVVLILGRFTPERKAILDSLREELRKHNYSPIVFDFERPENRDFTETARTLAHLARFILADITEPSSIPQELQAIVPELEVPVQPLLQEDGREYSMFPDFGKYPWVAPIFFYKDQSSLISSLHDEIIAPADEKARELAIVKAKRLERP